MIPIVESFQLLDDVVDSAIGNKYGDIYDTQLKLAKSSNLNKTEVPHYYETLMKPVMTMRKAPAEPKL